MIARAATKDESSGPAPRVPEPAHILVPDTEGGTRISLSLVGAFKDWIRKPWPKR